MRVALMHHGEAENHSASGRDEDRRLTASGRDAVTFVAEQLRPLFPTPPTRNLVSPLERTVECARLCTPILGLQEESWEKLPLLAPHGASPAALGRVLEGMARSSDTALVIGHRLELELLAHHLLCPLSGEASKPHTLPQGTVPGTTVVLSLERNIWTVSSVHAPPPKSSPDN